MFIKLSLQCILIKYGAFLVKIN